MKQPFYVVNAAQGSDTAEILIYKPISTGWYSFWSSDEDITAQKFIEDFKKLEANYKNINIRINSPGGIVYDGMAIFNAIQQSKANTTTYIDGLAASMAAIIAIASDKVKIAKNGLFMLHAPMSWVGGNASEMREQADILDKHSDALITVVAEKTGLTTDEVKAKWFDYKDHWLTANESLEAKLVDEIVEKEGKVPENASQMSVSALFEYYEQNSSKLKPEDHKNIFQQFVDKLDNILSLNNTKNEEVTMKTIALALNLDEKADVKSILDAIKALQDSNASLTNSLETEKTAKQAAEDSLKVEQDKVAALTTEKTNLEQKLADKPAASTTAVDGPDKQVDTTKQVPVDEADEVVKSFTKH